MLLAIDVGNTETVLGLFALHDEGKLDQPVSCETGLTASAGTDRQITPKTFPPGRVAGLLRSWRVATVVDRTPDEHALLVSQLLQLAGVEYGMANDRVDELSKSGERSLCVSGFAVSSSVPTVVFSLVEMVKRWFFVPVVVVEPGCDFGLRVAYDRPQDVGPDRIANAIAATDLYGCPVVVVDLGTATTFDVVSGSGDYVGGAIVPGLGISMEALVVRAAALRQVEMAAPRSVIGRSTVESVQSGAIFGTAALVDGMCAKIEQELGSSPTVVATGGLAALVAPYCSNVDAYEPWLTLHGLRLAYERFGKEK